MDVRRHLLAAGIVLALAATFSGTGASQTGGIPQWGYLWANQPAADFYTPAPQYQRNSTGGLSQIKRYRTGEYRLFFPIPDPGLHAGTVNVTAYGSGTEMCKVAFWQTDELYSMLMVDVYCFTASGSPVDTQFTASFTFPDRSDRFGSVLADQPAAGSYTPSVQYNSGDAANSITRRSAGLYQVRLPGLGGAGGTVKVTAFGVAGDACKVVSWWSSGGDQLVDVACHSAAGAAADAKFTMTFAGDVGILGVRTDPPASRAYLWANLRRNSFYAPDRAYQFNSAGGTNTVARTRKGVYVATLPGLAVDGGHVHVTAYGPTAVRCKVSWWNRSGPDEKVEVRCFTGSGSPADARFVLNFVNY